MMMQLYYLSSAYRYFIHRLCIRVIYEIFFCIVQTLLNDSFSDVTDIQVITHRRKKDKDTTLFLFHQLQIKIGIDNN